MGKWLGWASLLLLLMILHLGVCIDTLRRSTPTVDEVAHLPAGLTYLQKRTFRLYPHNPPLVRILAAAAAVPYGLNVDYDGTWQRHNPPNHWLFAFRFLLANADRAATCLAAFTSARMVIAVWSAFAIPVLFLWGRWWFSEQAGILAAVLWTLSPNVIAHAGFVTTDVPAAVTGLVASFLFAIWLDEGTWKSAAVAGVVLGLAQLTKFSCLLLYPMWAVWLLAELVCKSRSVRSEKVALGSESISNKDVNDHSITKGWFNNTCRWGCQFVVLVVISIFVINAGYLFEGTFQPIGDYQFVSETLTRQRTQRDPRPKPTSSTTYNYILQNRINRFEGLWLHSLPTPFPKFYVSGFDEQKFEAEGKYQMYLRGEFADADGKDRAGWWYYYFYALGVKLPLATLALLVTAVGRQVFDPRLSGMRIGVLSFLVLVPLLGMSFLTDINIGLRYTLPLFPFLMLLAGTAARTSDGRIWKAVLFGAVAWNAVALWRIHPHELSYFNECAGGPKNGRFHLIDSNIDWGQDLRNLGHWLEKHPDWRSARLAYFGSVPPEFEGIENYQMAPRMLPKESENPEAAKEQWLPWESASDPTSYGPQPGKYIISVNFERGMFFHTPVPFSRLATIANLKPAVLRPAAPMIFNQRNAYAYFQHFTPTIEPEIGYSMLLYDISLEDANRVRKELGLPVLR